MRKTGVFMLALASLLLSVSAAFAQDGAPDPASVQLVEVASGFDRPLYVTNAGDGSNRLFVLEQAGLIRIIDGTTVLDTPFLDVSDLLSRDVFGGGYTERGLLGLAFHPNYAENGQFYINYTDVRGDTAVARYTVSADNPNVADPASAYIVFTQFQPYANHNGGHMAFGPDGYLYIAMGDGGSGGDPQNNAQNASILLGKILRIDVDGGDPYAIPADNPVSQNSALAPEIWALGLRNPWRFSFDADTGDLYIGDVGQGEWEEVNFEPADSPGGVNYGWDYYEATHPYENAEDAPETLTEPFTEYDHGQGISVTGGYVYRGAALPQLEGVYVYGDFGYGRIWTAWRDAAGAWQTSVFNESSGHTISSFGQDEQHELYLVDYAGAVLKFAPA